MLRPTVVPLAVQAHRPSKRLRGRRPVRRSRSPYLGNRPRRRPWQLRPSTKAMTAIHKVDRLLPGVIGFRPARCHFHSIKNWTIGRDPGGNCPARSSAALLAGFTPGFDRGRGRHGTGHHRHGPAQTVRGHRGHQRPREGPRARPDQHRPKQLPDDAQAWPAAQDRVWAVEGCNGISKHLAQRLVAVRTGIQPFRQGQEALPEVAVPDRLVRVIALRISSAVYCIGGRGVRAGSFVAEQPADTIATAAGVTRVRLMTVRRNAI